MGMGVTLNWTQTKYHFDNNGICHRDLDYPPIITKEQWLQAQLVCIQKLARGEEL
jgi:hypothetical protein